MKNTIFIEKVWPRDAFFYWVRADLIDSLNFAILICAQSLHFMYLEILNIFDCQNLSFRGIVEDESKIGKI